MKSGARGQAKTSGAPETLGQILGLEGARSARVVAVRLGEEMLAHVRVERSDQHRIEQHVAVRVRPRTTRPAQVSPVETPGFDQGIPRRRDGPRRARLFSIKRERSDSR
jgi:hypothetical protein